MERTAVLSHGIGDGSAAMNAKLGNLAKSADRGSASIVAVGLVVGIITLLTIIAAVGNVLISKAQAHTAADIAALAGASVQMNASADACSLAAQIASDNQAQLDDCAVENDEVQVAVTVRTRVPLVSRVTVRSRAGPVPCAA